MGRLRRYSLRSADTDAKREKIVRDLLCHVEFLEAFFSCVLDDAQRIAPTADTAMKLLSGGDFYLLIDQTRAVAGAYVYPLPPRNGGILILDMNDSETRKICADAFERYGFRKLKCECHTEPETEMPAENVFTVIGTSRHDVLIGGRWLDTIHLELKNPNYDQSGEDVNASSGISAMGRTTVLPGWFAKLLRRAASYAARPFRGG